MTQDHDPRTKVHIEPWAGSIVASLLHTFYWSLEKRETTEACSNAIFGVIVLFPSVGKTQENGSY